MLLLRCFCARRESSSSGDLNQGERSTLTEDSPLEAVVAHAPEPQPLLVLGPGVRSGPIAVAL